MKYLIAVPCMDMMHTSFTQSLMSMERIGSCQFAFIRNSLVYDARNMIVNTAIDGDFDRVLWLDSDMVFDTDIMIKLAQDLDEGREMVCGLFFRRQSPYKPCIYDTLYITQNDDGTMTPHSRIYEDFPRNEIFPIKAVGFGAVMTSVKMLRQIRDEFGQPFTPAVGFGEDLSFCARADQLGIGMYCDSRIKVGHCGQQIVTEETWMTNSI